MYKQLNSKLSGCGWSRGLGAVLLAVCLVAPTTNLSASWLSQGKKQFIDKPIKWAGERSGVTDTDKKVKDAADATAKTNQQVQTALGDLKPQLEETAAHARATSDSVTDLLRVLKWPLVSLIVALFAWASGKAFATWKSIPSASIKR